MLDLLKKIEVTKDDISIYLNNMDEDFQNLSIDLKEKIINLIKDNIDEHFFMQNVDQAFDVWEELKDSFI